MKNQFEKFKLNEFVSNDSEKEFIGNNSSKTSDFEINKLSVNESSLLSYSRDNIQKRLEKEVEARIKNIEQKAYSEAFELGLIEGARKAQDDLSSKIKEQLEKFKDIIEILKFQRLNLSKKYEKDIIKIILYIAEFLVRKELKEDKSVIPRIVQKAVEDIEGEKVIEILLSESDYLAITSDEYLGSDFDIENVNLKVKQELSPGDCLVRTENGFVDASLKTKIDNIYKDLLLVTPR